MRRFRWAITFTVLALVGCVSKSYKLTVPVGEEQIIVDPTPGITRLKIRRLRVEDPTHLRTMVENRRNYRLDFFRQSKDPYFGRDRWSESCLRRNSTGPIVESREGIFFRSNATADSFLKTEVCLQESVDVVQLIGECRRDGIFFELTATGEKAASLKFLCPDELNF